MKKEDLDAEDKSKSDNTGKSKPTDCRANDVYASESLPGTGPSQACISPCILLHNNTLRTFYKPAEEPPHASFLVSTAQISLAVVLPCCGGEPRHRRGYLPSGVTPRALPGERECPRDQLTLP